jgi:transmembrane sensor
MNAPLESDFDRASIRARAAQWTVRRDRGLSGAEAIEFQLWLAADPRHPAAMERSGSAWALLDRSPESFAKRMLGIAARKRSHWRCGFVIGSLAAAAVLFIGIFSWRGEVNLGGAAAPALMAAGPRVVTLADGSLVRLNLGGEVIEEFAATERRVRLTRGEAHFTVAKNPARPFVVIAGALRVRAVGTAFNVNLQAAQVEVLVTEGIVRLIVDDRAAADEPLVEAGERAVIPAASSTQTGMRRIVIARVDGAEMDRVLAWHDSIVRLGGATLAELADDFERRFGQRVVIPDPEIAQMRVGGRVRGDDMDGFATLLATTFDLDVERATDGPWVLRKKKPTSR